MNDSEDPIGRYEWQPSQFIAFLHDVIASCNKFVQLHEASFSVWPEQVDLDAIQMYRHRAQMARDLIDETAKLPPGSVVIASIPPPGY